MRIVVDSSVLVAAMGRRSRVRRLLFRQGAEWVIPSVVREEVVERVEVLAPRVGTTPAHAREVVAEILGRATEARVSPKEHCVKQAATLIGKRDASDIPFVAVALKLHAIGIWSLDKDFDGILGVPRFMTAGIERLLSLVGPAEEE